MCVYNMCIYIYIVYIYVKHYVNHNKPGMLGFQTFETKPCGLDVSPTAWAVAVIGDGGVATRPWHAMPRAETAGKSQG